jgi:hypothetical protein
MAQEKPLDLAVVQAWLTAWDESDLFSDAAIQHLQSLIADTHCIVVVTLGWGREPHSLVFRRRKYVLPALLCPSSPIIVPSASKGVAETAAAVGPRPRNSADLSRVPADIRQMLFRQMFVTRDITRIPSMFVGPVAPVGPPIGQLWHQTGVRFERVLQWDGADWVIVGHVIDSPSVLKQGKRVCDFTQARSYARWLATRLDCEFIYIYDGSTWGNA